MEMQKEITYTLTLSQKDAEELSKMLCYADYCLTSLPDTGVSQARIINNTANRLTEIMQLFPEPNWSEDDPEL